MNLELIIMFSENVKLLISGNSHGISEQEAEVFVVLGSESIEGFSKVFGDGGLVENDVIFNDSHVLLWVFGNFNDVIEGSPVQGLGVNRLANWDGLLESLKESEDSNDASDSFIRIFVLVSLLKEVNSFVEADGSLVSFVDAKQEVGEVESSNICRLKESLSNLSSHCSCEDNLFWNFFCIMFSLDFSNPFFLFLSL